MWQGPELVVQGMVFDIAEVGAFASKAPVDHTGRFEYDGNVGYGLYEHLFRGRFPSTGSIEQAERRITGGEMTDRPPTTRDLARTRDGLTAWLARTLRPGAEPVISELHVPRASGMSSETLMCEATWIEHGQRSTSYLVVRVPPDPGEFPVFPNYDMEGQFRTMALARDLSTAPVPEPLWFEADPDVLGRPFLVMQRVVGLVAPDVMPYTFGGNWFYDATLEQQQGVVSASLEVLAALHAVEAAEHHFAHLDTGLGEETALRRLVNRHVIDYYKWAAGDIEVPIIERCLSWLEERWPEDEGPTVLSWGDARIGNILFDDFTPVAVLDWEMAALGPREVDLAWFNLVHEYLHDSAAKHGGPGMPHVLRRRDCVTQYERLTGHRCRDMDWYSMLAAVRLSVSILRIRTRAVKLDGAPMPANVNELVPSSMLHAMVASTYWSDREGALPS